MPTVKTVDSMPTGQWFSRNAIEALAGGHSALAPVADFWIFIREMTESGA